ncbi:DUF6248 family natural product biosynthesis protein [Streptomyces umbrinus]|uniref:DUF6248 family natural product biosynthesis protein n=1 Tax=Streptomyces umbrinus TaxID=67370 RepID=UPI0035947AAF
MYDDLAALRGRLDPGHPRPRPLHCVLPHERGGRRLGPANAWTKSLRKIEDAYPHGFHRWCSCEAGTCHPCVTGQHDKCVSADGPRVDEAVGTITDRRGFVVAVIRYGPGQRPCRWICPCTHPTDVEETAGTDPPGQPPAAQRAVPAHGPAPGPEGQLILFASGPEERWDGDAP